MKDNNKTKQGSKFFSKNEKSFKPQTNAPKTNAPKASLPKMAKTTPAPEVATWPMRLNRYLSQSGICARRQARMHIEAGNVRVNDLVVLEMGHRVEQPDTVIFQGKIISPRPKTYILMNKPKDTITTTADPEGRKTVMDILGKEGDFLYPVGRLDRQTTGLLLLTNDGDLAQKLAHPSHQITKLYAVETDKAVSQKDIDHLLYGVQLEEGIAKANKAEYIDGKTKNEVGIEIHFGWNRVVRRMFEALGYKVVKLDRVMYAGLTKINLPRGRFRHLTDAELRRLKHFMP